MKKLILLLLAITLISCNLRQPEPSASPKPSAPPKPVVVQTENHKAKSIEYITGALHTSRNSIGLYKVTLQDGREILLYNDSKGIAMIQLIR